MIIAAQFRTKLRNCSDFGSAIDNGTEVRLRC